MLVWGFAGEPWLADGPGPRGLCVSCWLGACHEVAGDVAVHCVCTLSRCISVAGHSPAVLEEGLGGFVSASHQAALLVPPAAGLGFQLLQTSLEELGKVRTKRTRHRAGVSPGRPSKPAQARTPAPVPAFFSPLGINPRSAAQAGVCLLLPQPGSAMQPPVACSCTIPGSPGQ